MAAPACQLGPCPAPQALLADPPELLKASTAVDEIVKTLSDDFDKWMGTSVKDLRRIK